MTYQALMHELEKLGQASYKKILQRHGVPEPCFGVKISELKKLQKRVKTDHALALQLFDSGNYDAMYLAGMIADKARLTQRDLRRWISKTPCSVLASATVAWAAADSPHGLALALSWIDAKRELTVTAGWSTLASIVSVVPDDRLDLSQCKRLLQRTEGTIHRSPNDVRQAMNQFVIAVGSYVPPLTEIALETAERIGPVTVDVGDTACQTPYAPDRIRKARSSKHFGRKRPSAQC